MQHFFCRFAHIKQWGFSSSGRASGSQSEGGRFESGILHKSWFFPRQRHRFFDAVSILTKIKLILHYPSDKIITSFATFQCNIFFCGQ